MSFNTLLAAPRYPAPIRHERDSVDSDPNVLLARSILDVSQKAKHALAKTAFTQTLSNKLKPRLPIPFPHSDVTGLKNKKGGDFKRSISSPLSESFWTDSWYQGPVTSKDVEVQGESITSASHPSECYSPSCSSYESDRPDSPVSFISCSTERTYTFI
ncbi:hypothetical protein BCV70DRAFT_44552 [Testicularia cyperi]|uniref:Uncharacterized protein n=1 Tax=Testicularia cyperi TaxID=1882483 RepID=A0A317XJR4_9BASI|nr:hypothetical protein BCV70DRAFT_44552 [Testicularia cyperi]